MEKLIERAKSGDARAFAELTGRCQNMAFAYAVSRLGDFHLAEDAVQESFIAAYYGLGSLTEPRAFPGWLRGIVRHQCQRILRHRPAANVPLEHAGDLVAPTGNPALLAERRETSAAVLAIVMALPADQRDVVVLYYLRDYSQREIAAFLDLPLATINNRLHAARTRLKRRMTTMVTDTLNERKLTDDFAKRIGEIVKVRGPLVDIRFDDDQIPELFTELSAAGGAGGLHVVQRLGANLYRGVAVEATGLKAGLGLIASEDMPRSLPDALLEATVRGAMGKRAAGPTILETGIKVIDLLSPLTADGGVGLFGSPGVGKGVLLGELVRRLAADVRGLNLFYLVRPIEKESTRHMRRVDEDILGMTDKVGSLETFWLLTDRATDTDYAGSSEFLDAALFCSPVQAVRSIWPAIDPLRSRSRLLTTAVAGEEHVQVAARALEILRRAKELMTDAMFLEFLAIGARAQAAERLASWVPERLARLPDPERLLVERAQKIENFFAQPFLVAEPYNKRPGATVSRAETVAVCRDILDGKYDHIPAEAFHFVGGIEEVMAKAARL